MKTVSTAFVMLLFASSAAFSCEGCPANRQPAGIHSKAADAENPFRATIEFLKWYKLNKKQLTGPLIKREGKHGNYRIDFTKTEKLLSVLRMGGYVTASYLSELRSYTLRIDDFLKKHPQNDFIVPGLESDIVTKVMDDMDFMEDIEALKEVGTLKKGDTVLLNLKTTAEPLISFNLIRQRGKWMIEKINGDFRKTFAPIVHSN